jgi:Tol biopolymer transport system component
VVALRGDKGLRRRVQGVALCAFVAFGVLPVGASAARHYEKVSPAEKGLGDIVGDGATTVASRFGDAVAFNSRTPFGDTVGSGTIGQTQYVARRTDEAWEVHAITPTPRPDAKQVFFAPTLLQMYSEDLRSAILRAYDLPEATDDMPLRNNIYVEDTATRALETVTVSQVDPPTIPDFLSYPQFYWGISADARHVAFVTSTQFLPGAVPGVPNVYQWDDGVLSVASVLPDGTVAANGADTPTNLRGAMSADGSRLLFTASTGGNTQLYLRVDGSSTAWVSETELDPSDPSYQPDPSGVQVMGMTPDGRHVLFLTDTPLLPDDTNGGPDLYRYTDSADPSGDSNLTMISPDGDLGGAELAGMSDDGERVYYQTPAPRLVVWDHGTTRVINDGAPIDGAEIRLVTSPGSPGYGRVTPDGMWLAFATRATVDGGVHGLTGEVTNQHREMYLYSLRENRLVCVSCPPGPAMSDITVLPAATQGEPSVGNAGFRPRYLSEGGQVFFSTAEALVAQDTNGVLDAYEYDPATGTVSLLSTGTGNDPTTFTDASASGDDVFIVTRQRLVTSDRDDLVDLYDVRDGSSLPEVVEQPTQPECQGDGCQPPSPAGPPEDLLGSLLFEDDGTRAAGRLFGVGQRLVVRGASGLLPVRLFVAGRLAWSGRGLRAGAIRRSRAGTYEVRLRLKKGARAQLRATGVYTTLVRLRFDSVGGDLAERTTRVTFRAAAKKGR